jgi:hypothetical protein
MRGVQVGSGPSSKVNAIVRAGSRSERDWPPEVSMIGPPSRTAAGTPAAGSASPDWLSGANRALAYASTNSKLLNRAITTTATSQRNAVRRRRTTGMLPEVAGSTTRGTLR